MAKASTNNLLFTTYTVKNESTRGAHVYMGIAAKGNNATTVDYFPHKVVACKTTYLFASIVGTRNVKITRPTTTDPYIYVQTREVDAKQCSLPPTSLLKSGDKTNMVLRTMSSDPSITIHNNGCNYGLSTFTYNAINACSINGLLYKTYGTPGQSNVVWQFKTIIGDGCIVVSDKDGVITFTNICVDDVIECDPTCIEGT
jgi:hypothetical protein